MRGKNVLGIVFANADDDVISELTGVRSMASVPFGGGYRFIDFTLSNMVNAGMTKVGIITNNNYQSLMDHVGGGKPWDLTGRNSGLYLLPPFNTGSVGKGSSKIGALKNISHFLSKSNEEFVMVSDCSYISNIDFSDVFDAHESTGADITILYKHGKAPALSDQLALTLDGSGRITEMTIGAASEDEVDFAIKCLVMRKALLERLVNDAYAKSENFFERDVLLHNLTKLNIRGYEVKGFCPVIDSVKSYFDANFALLDKDVYKELFFARPVYSKVYEDMPAIYGKSSAVRNSLVADGCVIKGSVENSIIFRDTRVEKGAAISNAIVLPHCIISADSSVNYTILDKDVTVGTGRHISGAESFPVYIGKGIRV